MPADISFQERTQTFQIQSRSTYHRRRSYDQPDESYFYPLEVLLSWENPPRKPSKREIQEEIVKNTDYLVSIYP